MKKIFLLLGLFLSMQAQANNSDSVFKKDSELPRNLQERVLAAVQSKCANLIMNYGLSEIATEVRIERIDQGVIDRFYTTTFFSRYLFDGTHPTTTYITVESAEYSFSNGDNLEVTNISSPDGCNN